MSNLIYGKKINNLDEVLRERSVARGQKSKLKNS